jgi:hypothetical protein
MTTITDIASASTAANSIDGAFPVAGQDNNSQGFRDNFSFTQTSLQKVVTVLTDINTNTAKTNVEFNDFNGTRLENAEIRNLYGSVAVNGSVSSAIELLDVQDSEYFTYQLGADVVIRFSNWPESNLYRKVRIAVTSDGTARDIDFATTSGVIKVDSNLTLPLTLSDDNSINYIFEAWSINGGNTVFVTLLGEFA